MRSETHRVGAAQAGALPLGRRETRQPVAADENERGGSRVRVRPGPPAQARKTYQDFLEAWYPDHGFGVPVRGPYLARNTQDDREIVALCFLDIPDLASMTEELAGVSQQEAVRHERIDEVIESTALRGIYEIDAEFDFSSDDTVARTRPGGREDEQGT